MISLQTLLAQAVQLPLLTLVWAIPLGASLIELGLTGFGRRQVSVVANLLTLLVAILVAAGFDSFGPEILSERLWIGSFRWEARVDGLSVLFLPLCGILGLLVSLFGQRTYGEAQAGWQAATLALQGCLQGMAVSADLLQFWVFFTLEIFPCYMLIARWGVTEHRVQAAARCAQFFGIASLLFLAGTLLLGAEHLRLTGHWSTAVVELIHLSLDPGQATVIFMLLFLSVAIRTPMFPFHGWMPAALEHGPVVGLNVFLLGVKVGILALLRFIIPILPDQVAFWAPEVSVLGIAGLLYGGLLALVQPRLRRVLAFVTLSHMGYVVPALFSLNRYGMEGGVVEMLNLGTAAAGLYFATGFMHQRAGTSDFAQLRNVAPAMPRLSMAFLVITLTSLGMPGTLGFDALHLVLEGALEAQAYGVAILLGVGTVISAGCLLWNYQRLFLQPDMEITDVKDLDGAELFTAAVVCAMVVTGGTHGHPVVRFVQPGVAEIMSGAGIQEVHK